MSRPIKATLRPSIKPTRPKGKSAPATVQPATRRTRSPTAAEVQEIFRRFHAETPEPKGELEHTNPYTLLVAVVLSAQATDSGVNKATRALFALADSPEKMLGLGEERVRDLIRTIGLFRTKAKNVMALSERLVGTFDSVVPADGEQLESLPGVGRKTANVVLNMAFGQPTMAVDTHVFRVANRMGLSRGKTPEMVEKDLLKAIPASFAMHAHHWLILHGRYLCKARKPECWRCPVEEMCRFKAKTADPNPTEA